MFTSDHRQVLFQLDETALRVSRTDSLEPKCNFGPFEAPIRSFSFINRHSHVVVLLENGCLHILDVLSGALIVRFAPEGRAIRRLDAISDAGIIASLGEDAHVRVWDVYDNRLLTQIPMPQGFQRIHLLNATRLTTVSEERSATLWDIASGTRVADLPRFMDRSIDGEKLLVYGDALELRSARDGSSVATAPLSNVVDAQFIGSTGRVLFLQDLADLNRAVFSMWDPAVRQTRVLHEGQREHYSIDQLDDQAIRISRGDSEWA